ncbi:X-Pro dipeptidyl-peptidase C-terminal non-catalytic domain-containing protein, partial [Globomyces pollinis-pini]
RGVLPVGNSTELLEKALKDHTSNIDVYASATKVLFKDDPFGISTLQALSPLERMKNQNQIVVPHLCWGGWLDAATARTVLTRFELFGNIPQIAIIGPWNHEMNTNCSLFKKGNLDPLEKVQFELIARFFHSALVMQAPITENVLYYYTMGVEEWRKTSTWPIVKEQTIFYFGKSMNLEDTKPTTETELAEFKVDYSATTTKTNRWYTQLLRPLHYSDPPRLTVPTEITGSPKLELIMSSSIPDTNIFVYLEAESPSGFVHYITEGMKRSIHGTDSMLSVDKREITPDHPFHVKITLLPTSIVLPAGYCLRIALAGSDADTFVSKIGDCQWKIFAGSLISLPIVQ